MKSPGNDRRRFLKGALVCAASAAAPRARSAPAPVESDPDRQRLEKLVARYGSELGSVRRVGG